jgi:16S rRNA G1207 methylase RsmC
MPLNRDILPAESLILSYENKRVDFKFRGRNFRFALSQGLFSSANIDTGSRFLLRALSRLWDEDLRQGKPLPRTILDAGCGTGVLGICAAGTLADQAPGAGGLRVRAQDRDELARAFTEYNARNNGISPEVLEAHTEPLLAGPPDSHWDLILSNIPAKAGLPVLRDFIPRSAALLNPGGRVLVVAVTALAEMFRLRLLELGLPLLYHEAGREHQVFIYGPGTGGPPEQVGDRRNSAPPLEENPLLNPDQAETPGAFLRENPAYLRNSGDYTLEHIPYHIDAFQGLGDFDNPGGAIRTAAKLADRLGLKRQALPPGILIHEPGQGHFPVWFLKYLGTEAAKQRPLVFSGRNILALEASRHNAAIPDIVIRLVPAIDLASRRDALLAAAGGPGGSHEAGKGAYGFIAAFPEPAPRTDRFDAYWEGLEGLLKPGGIVLIALPSSEAERFDRKKQKHFIRLGDLKRNGFRALAYHYFEAVSS